MLLILYFHNFDYFKITAFQTINIKKCVLKEPTKFTKINKFELTNIIENDDDLNLLFATDSPNKHNNSNIEIHVPKIITSLLFLTYKITTIS